MTRETAESILQAADALRKYAALPRNKKYRAATEQAAAHYAVEAKAVLAVLRLSEEEQAVSRRKEQKEQTK